MLKFSHVQSVSNDVTRYTLSHCEAPLTYFDVLTLWGRSGEFRTYFNELLAASPYKAFRWETPAFNKKTAIQPFEFVLINEQSFIKRKTDRETYRAKFSDDDLNAGIVCFANLSGDASLIVPSPRTEADAYGHLASFVRNAPVEQRDCIWQVVAAQMNASLSDQSVWLSTAGGGVAWLHVRLDSYPKYYGYAPYREM